MIGNILQAELEELIRDKKWDELREAMGVLDDADVAEIIVDLPPEDEGIIFRVLPRDRASRIFGTVDPIGVAREGGNARRAVQGYCEPKQIFEIAAAFPLTVLNRDRRFAAGDDRAGLAIDRQTAGERRMACTQVAGLSLQLIPRSIKT